MSITDELIRLLTDAASKRMWGEITVVVQDGNPCMIKTYTMKKLPDNENNHVSVRTLFNKSA